MENRFLLQTKQDYYLLGWMISDGYVASTNNRVAIKIKKDDRQVLSTLQTYYPYFRLSLTDLRESIILSCYSKSLKQDFMNLGILPRKSYENKESLQLKTLDKSLISHTIRGMFDGDGCYSFSKKNQSQLEITYISNSLNLVEELKYVLKEYFNIDSFIKTRYTNTEGKNEVYNLKISSIKSMLEFINIMFNDCGDLYLNRKKLIVDAYKLARTKLQDRKLLKQELNQLKEKEYQKRYRVLSRLIKGFIKIGNSNRNKTISEEHKDKVRQSRLGTKMKEESKLKMIASKKQVTASKRYMLLATLSEEEKSPCCKYVSKVGKVRKNVACIKSYRICLKCNKSFLFNIREV